MQIRPWGLLVYERKEFTGISTKQHNNSNKRIQSYTGVLTPYSKKKLKRAIQLIVATAKDKEATNYKSGKTFKFKLNFITFTLPAPQNEITDKQIKHCLDNWIKRAKRKFGLGSYVWRAERQKNGNIHFHMITDTWIHYEKIRNDWNETLAPLGFIKRYQEKNGNKQPNSTDVHSITRIKNLSQYFIKYMSKKHKEGEKPITGKVWDCSQNLKTKENCELIIDSDVATELNKIYSNVDVTSKEDVLYSLIFLNETQQRKLFPEAWQQKWQAYLKGIRLNV